MFFIIVTSTIPLSEEPIHIKEGIIQISQGVSEECSVKRYLISSNNLIIKSVATHTKYSCL